jgi:hypothetical protein
MVRRRPGRPPEVDLDNVILDALNKFLYHSFRTRPRVLDRPLSTIRDNASPHQLNVCRINVHSFYFIQTSTLCRSDDLV